MKRIVLFLLVVFSLSNAFAQRKKKKDIEVQMVAHEVKMGETVRTISQKYLVEPAEIYKYNNEAVDGISQGMVLQIPVPIKEAPAPVVEEKVVVVDTENNRVSMNKELEAKAKKDIPVEPKANVKQVTTIEKKSEMEHTVEPKETLYSLSKLFNVSVDEIKANNPKVAELGLQVGQVIRVKSSKVLEKYESGSEESSTAVVETKEVAKNPVAEQPRKPAVADLVKGNVIEHKVEPKETLYSLSRKYNMTIDQITELNPDLKNRGLQIDEIVKLKSN